MNSMDNIEKCTAEIQLNLKRVKKAPDDMSKIQCLGDLIADAALLIEYASTKQRNLIRSYTRFE